MKKCFGLLAALILLFDISTAVAATDETPLATLDYHVVGIGLQAGPEYQAVPKGLPTQVNAGIDAQGFDVAGIIAQLPKDYRVKAELSGPAFPTPKTLETLPGKPFDIPTLALTGKHTLNNIRLVDGQGKTLFGAVPQAVIIESINDPLITEVKTRPLTLEELQERGVTFDSSNFTAYEFTAGIATESGQVPINLPVIIPEADAGQPRGHPAAAGHRHPPADHRSESPPDSENIKLPPNLTVAPFMMQLKEPTGRRQHRPAADPRHRRHPRQHRLSAPVLQRPGPGHQRRPERVRPGDPRCPGEDRPSPRRGPDPRHRRRPGRRSAAHGQGGRRLLPPHHAGAAGRSRRQDRHRRRRQPAASRPKPGRPTSPSKG